MFDKGSCSYINIPRQPNETDCGVYVMKWMELIDPTVLANCCEAKKEYNIEKWAEKTDCGKENEKRVETIRQVKEMRNIKAAAVLWSSYIQVSSADLYSK
ncbi:hypothetical protein PIB30_091820 [Stylosanthes scabra]|uniref:Ubiquitin-like protease family profile domain-containing protein n=1 Tax=Stylosanthes scabra TaxID=79078 RepID=A0ABU6TWL4_9FABA|nr:hypothetical protein [Stylosanthes scabra]